MSRLCSLGRVILCVVLAILQRISVPNSGITLPMPTALGHLFVPHTMNPFYFGGTFDQLSRGLYLTWIWTVRSLKSSQEMRNNAIVQGWGPVSCGKPADNFLPKQRSLLAPNMKDTEIPANPVIREKVTRQCDMWLQAGMVMALPGLGSALRQPCFDARNAIGAQHERENLENHLHNSHCIVLRNY